MSILPPPEVKYSLDHALNIGSNAQKSNLKEKLSRKTLEYEVRFDGVAERSLRTRNVIETSEGSIASRGLSFTEAGAAFCRGEEVRPRTEERNGRKRSSRQAGQSGFLGKERTVRKNVSH
ncbi:MAG: hypothetical protein J5846_07035 [Desulfovibrio sp.]|nr:hypothetical protein [Desulfovibrio sp.]